MIHTHWNQSYHSTVYNSPLICWKKTRDGWWKLRCSFQKQVAGAALWLLAVACAVIQTRAAVIDDFSQGGVKLEAVAYEPPVGAFLTGLQTNHVIGGTRQVTVQRSMGDPTNGRSLFEIDPDKEQFTFTADGDFGYFSIAYGTEEPLEIDLRADGSTAFLLEFSSGTRANERRGPKMLIVNGVAWNFSRDLAALNGAGTISVPFSHFSTEETFVANEIILSAVRVDPTNRLVLDSITTGAQLPPRLTLALGSPGEIEVRWNTNSIGFILETTADIGSGAWKPVTRTSSVVRLRKEFLVRFRPTDTVNFFRLRKD